MFSNSVDFEKSQRKNLKDEYSYSLKKENLRGFELNGELVFYNRIKIADLI